MKVLVAAPSNDSHLFVVLGINCTYAGKDESLRKDTNVGYMYLTMLQVWEAFLNLVLQIDICALVR